MLVEGQTERAIVEQVFAPVLRINGVYLIYSAKHLSITPRDNSQATIASERPERAIIYGNSESLTGFLTCSFRLDVQRYLKKSLLEGCKMAV